MNIFRISISNLIITENIDFSVGRHQCILTIDPEIKKLTFSEKEQYKGFLVESGHIDIFGITSPEEGVEVATDLCWLLTFITMSNVTWYKYEYNGNSRIISVSAFYNHFRPVLAYNTNHYIKNFLESSWDKYQSLKDKRKLPAVIHYLLECDRPNQLLEFKILFVGIVFESLKSTYAHCNDYKYDGSGFLKPELKKLKCEDGSKCNRRYFSFKDLLSQMLHEHNMKPNLNDIIKLRNEVFHNGLSANYYKHMMSTYDCAQDIIREYLLRLLDYKGKYMVYSVACRKTDIIQ